MPKVLQYQSLVEPVLVPAASVAPSFDWFVQASEPLRLTKQITQSWYVEPLAPNSFVLQKLDWLQPPSQPINYGRPKAQEWYVEPLAPNSFVPQKLDWFMQASEPLKLRQPKAQEFFVSPLDPDSFAAPVVFPPRSTNIRVARGTTAAAARRFRERIWTDIDSSGSRLVNDDYTVVNSFYTDPDAGTITFNMNVYRLHQVTLGGNRTLAVANVNAVQNQRFVIKLIQDSTGSRTVTWWNTIRWVGGSPPTLTTGAGKADYFGFVTTGAGTYDGFVIGQNI